MDKAAPGVCERTTASNVRPPRAHGAAYLPRNSTSFPEARRLMQRSDLMSGELTMHEIGGRLKAEFEVTADKAKESVITLMQMLVDEKLVQVSDA